MIERSEKWNLFSPFFCATFSAVLILHEFLAKKDLFMARYILVLCVFVISGILLLDNTA